MLRGLWTLTWLEIKIFVREPLGFIGTVAAPVLLFIFLGRLAGRRTGTASSRALNRHHRLADLHFDSDGAQRGPVARHHHLDLSRGRHPQAPPCHAAQAAHDPDRARDREAAVYGGDAGRDDGGGTALLSRQVRRARPSRSALALLFSTLCIVSMGFLIASIVPTARFAQPIGALIMYPMLGLSGLFVPVASLPPAIGTIARFLPLTYAVSLLRGIWRGDGWIHHAGDVAALAIVLVVCTAVSSKVFRWE